MGDEAYWRQKSREWADDPDSAPTPEQIASFEERLDREVKQIQERKRQAAEAAAREAAQRRAAKMTRLRRAAMILAFLLVFAGTTLYGTVDSFAAGVDRFIATVLPEDGAEELRTEEKVGAHLDLELSYFEGMYLPEWMPKGYAMFEMNAQEHWRRIRYQNKNHDVICYEIAKPSYSVIVDDENVMEEPVYLHDSQGKIITADDTVYVVWEDEAYIYTLSGRCELRDTLIKIVERSVKVEGASE